VESATERMALPPQENTVDQPRILIVDDEIPLARLISRWLEVEGYDCWTAHDAPSGLELLSAEHFDLLISNVRMPGLSGLSILEQARKKNPDIAVIMAAAVDDREMAIRSLQLGAYAYIVKPMDQNELFINVINALKRRRLEMDNSRYQEHLEELVREQTREIRRSQEEILVRLTAAEEYRHDETGAHIRRIGLYAEALAHHLGLFREQTEMLRAAAPMHDVGKIGIPDAVLLKPGKLTSEEFKTIQQHTVIGGRILGGTDIPLLGLAQNIALTHHEKWDGSGYPNGLAATEIPEPGRIVAVADVYDALIHDRVYKRAMPEEKALDILCEGSGSHFDPRILDAFFSILPAIRDIRSKIAG